MVIWDAIATIATAADDNIESHRFTPAKTALILHSGDRLKRSNALVLFALPEIRAICELAG